MASPKPKPNPKPKPKPKRPPARGTAKVSTWGNSLGLRVPKELATHAGLHDGSEVTLEAHAGGAILVRPTRARKRWTAAELCAGVTPGTASSELDFGPPVGKEVW